MDKLELARNSLRGILEMHSADAKAIRELHFKWTMSMDRLITLSEGGREADRLIREALDIASAFYTLADVQNGGSLGGSFDPAVFEPPLADSRGG